MARLPRFLLRPLRRCARAAMARRGPDVIIGGEDDPYLARWFVLPRNPLLNIYLHRFLRSDDDRALHDHPWINASLVLEGYYDEHTIRAGGIHLRSRRLPGSLTLRGARAAHRIELPPEQPTAITLFLTGPRLRRWGFHCPHGWVFWRDFTTPDGRAAGAGCEARAERRIP